MAASGVVAVSAVPVQATAACDAVPASYSTTLLTAVNVQVVDAGTRMGMPRGAAEQARNRFGIQPIDGSLKVASAVAQQRIREETEMTRRAERAADGTTTTVASMYAHGDHVVGPVDGDLKVATAGMKQRMKEVNDAIKGAAAREKSGAATELPPSGKKHVDEIALTIRVQVPEGAVPESTMMVAMPRSDIPGVVAGQLMPVRVPASATPGSVIEITFGCSPEAPMTPEQKKLFQDQIEMASSRQSEGKEELDAGYSRNTGGGYQVGEYSTSEYKSTYDGGYQAGGYQVNEYKSVYD
uniref:Uncharacterized protein n=1 Tax=Rhizochromulina marina TaxID=1034831 RepID=A0A7S2RA61_9STRA